MLAGDYYVYEQSRLVLSPRKAIKHGGSASKWIDPLTEKLTKLSVATGIDVPVMECIPNLSRKGQLPSHFRHLVLYVNPIIISLESCCVRRNSEIARLFSDALMRISQPIKGRLALLGFSQQNCAKSKHGARCLLIRSVSLTKPACIYWNNHSSVDLMNPSRNECKDETSKTSDFWEYHGLARDGINLLLNNGFEESQKLFRSHRYNITLNVFLSNPHVLCSLW